MNSIKPYIYFFIGVLLAANTNAFSAELVDTEFSSDNFTVHVNGLSYHFSRDGQNEENFGAGLSYRYAQIKSDNNLLNDSNLAYEFDVYRDSYSDTGFAFGVAWKRRLGSYFDWGLKLGLVHENHASDTSGLFLIPFLLPFIESRLNGPANIRLTITPPVGDITNGMITFQLMITLGKQ